MKRADTITVLDSPRDMCFLSNSLTNVYVTTTRDCLTQPNIRRLQLAVPNITQPGLGLAIRVHLTRCRASGLDAVRE